MTTDSLHEQVGQERGPDEDRRFYSPVSILGLRRSQTNDVVVASTGNIKIERTGLVGLVDIDAQRKNNTVVPIH